MEYVTLIIVPARKNSEFLLISSLRIMDLAVNTSASAVYAFKNIKVSIRTFSHLPMMKPVSNTSLLRVWLTGLAKKLVRI